MKLSLITTTFCSAVLLIGSAIPCHASLIEFGATAPPQVGGTDISVNGTTILYLSTILTTLTVPGVPADSYSGLFLTESYCDPNSNQCNQLPGFGQPGGEVADNIYV